MIRWFGRPRPQPFPQIPVRFVGGPVDGLVGCAFGVAAVAYLAPCGGCYASGRLPDEHALPCCGWVMCADPPGARYRHTATDMDGTRVYEHERSGGDVVWEDVEVVKVRDDELVPA